VHYVFTWLNDLGYVAEFGKNSSHRKFNAFRYNILLIHILIRHNKTLELFLPKLDTFHTTQYHSYANPPCPRQLSEQSTTVFDGKLTPY